MKKIEVNVGIGLNMFFPETITIVIEDEVNEEPVKKRGRKPKTEKEITLELEKIIERRLSEDENKIIYLPLVLVQRPYILLSDKNGTRKIWEKDKLKIVLYYLWRITKIKWFVKKYNQR